MKRALLALLLFAHSLGAELIPADRLIDWSQCGIPGGVPVRSTIAATLSPSGGDDTAAIQSALNSAGTDQVVKLADGGSFSITQITIPAHRVLRLGTGTVITTGTSNAIQFADPYVFYGAIYLAADVAKGATTGTMGSVVPGSDGTKTQVQVGAHVQVQEENDTGAIFDGSEGSGGPWAKGQWVEITARSGDNLTWTPPLYASYSASRNVRIRFPSNDGSPAHNFCEWSGLEGGKIINTSSSSASIIRMQDTAYCWIKGVETQNAGVCHLWAFETFRCEIRDSYFHDVLAPITSSRGYGLQLGTPNGGLPPNKSSALLIENNAFVACRTYITVGYGAAGCVIGYNFFHPPPTDEVATHLKEDISVHSSFPHMNLIEGNVGTRGVVADSFHGNSSHNLIFRNWWGVHTAGKTGALSGIELDIHQRDFSAVGNVIGYSGLSAAVASALYSQEAPAAYDGAAASCFMLGYPSENGDMRTIDPDPEVAETLIRKGNYNFVAENIPESEALGEDALPASYYLAAKPSWFGAVAWPPIDPARPGAATNPARENFLNGGDEPDPTPTPTPTPTPNPPVLYLFR